MLTFGTGATDIASFTRLGGVFTSVITGNLVLFGLAAARASAALAEHTATSLAGYVAGVAVGARVIALARPRGRDRRTAVRSSTEPGSTAPGSTVPGSAAPGSAAPGNAAPGNAAPGDAAPGDTVRGDAGDEDWPAIVAVALAAQLVLLAGLSAGWELTGARPAGAAQFGLLALAAVAMGMQSASVRGLGRGDVSTTYLTGTLTALIAGLVTPGKRDWPGWRQHGPLLALAAGALVSGVLIANAPAAVPAAILAPLCLTLALRPTAWPPARPAARRGTARGGREEAAP